MIGNFLPGRHKLSHSGLCTGLSLKPCDGLRIELSQTQVLDPNLQAFESLAQMFLSFGLVSAVRGPCQTAVPAEPLQRNSTGNPACAPASTDAVIVDHIMSVDLLFVSDINFDCVPSGPRAQPSLLKKGPHLPRTRLTSSGAGMLTASGVVGNRRPGLPDPQRLRNSTNQSLARSAPLAPLRVRLTKLNPCPFHRRSEVAYSQFNAEPTPSQGFTSTYQDALRTKSYLQP